MFLRIGGRLINPDNIVMAKYTPGESGELETVRSGKTGELVAYQSQALLVIHTVYGEKIDLHGKEASDFWKQMAEMAN